MRNAWKISRFFVRMGLESTSSSSGPVVSTATQLQTIPRCLSCGSSHASSVPTGSASVPTYSPPLISSIASNSFLLAPNFSQRAAVHRRSFHTERPVLSSAKTKIQSTNVESPTKVDEVEEVAVDICMKSDENQTDKDESLETARPKRSSAKPPPDGEIGFVEGTIDEVRVLDVKGRPSRDDSSPQTSAAAKKKEKKKKSSDLIAMEKFGVIVSGEKAGELTAEDSMRSFQLADDDRSILAPPDEAPELRRKPKLAQNDVLDPKRKGFKIGDRAKPPVLDFSLRHALFDEAAQLEGGKTKRAFEMAIRMFNKVDPKYKRGHVEMIYQAANLMKEYDLHQDIDAYRMVFDLFPKGVLIPKGAIQAGFFHYPRQQDCAVDVLHQMEQNRLIPDKEIGKQLLQIFGRRSRPFRKFRRQTYWLPKFAYASPFPPLPLRIDLEDGLSVAKRLLERICVDLENEITVFRVRRAEDEGLDLLTTSSPWIASAMSPKQHELITRLPVDRPVYVKGPFPVFLRNRKVEYFTLWADLPDQLKAHYAEEEELFEDYMRQSKDIDELMESDITRQAFRGKKRKNVLAFRPSVHEQEDGIILALSVLETFSKELLTAWIKNLETSNPHLSDVPVIFSLSSAPPSELVVQEAETDSHLVTN